MRVRTPALKASDAKNLHGQDTGRSHISATQLSMFLNCPQRWDYRYQQHLELVSKPEPLALGAAFHTGIEHNDPMAASGRLMADARPVSSQEDYDKLLINAAVVTCAVRAYLERWPRAVAHMAEVPYRVQLRNPWTGYGSRSFDLLGYADGLIDRGEHFELIENKLVGAIGELAVRRLPLDRQLALECYGIWRATGKPVQQVSFRFTRKPSIKPKRNESTEDYIKRLSLDYTERGLSFYTHEETLYRASDDLLRIEQELWTWSQDVLRARTSSFSPRNTSHCLDFGGCPYLPLCLGDPDAIHLYRNTHELPEESEEEVARV